MSFKTRYAGTTQATLSGAAPAMPTAWTCPKCGATFPRNDTHAPGGDSCLGNQELTKALASGMEIVTGEVASFLYQQKLIKYRPGKVHGKFSKTCAYAPSWAILIYGILREESRSVLAKLADEEELREAVCAVAALAGNQRDAVVELLGEYKLIDPEPYLKRAIDWGALLGDSRDL